MEKEPASTAIDVATVPRSEDSTDYHNPSVATIGSGFALRWVRDHTRATRVELVETLTGQVHAVVAKSHDSVTPDMVSLSMPAVRHYVEQITIDRRAGMAR